MAKLTDKSRFVQTSAWGLGLTVCIIATLVWGKFYNWHFLPFNPYAIFPLLGLLAFSLMWTHYIIGTIREVLDASSEVTATYFRLTGYAVLVLICLHPGLLIYQRFRDGAGLPPGSYESYVAPGLGWVTLLGTASLLVFLAFEFHRKFADKTWWRYVVDASDVAMLAIIYHGFRLGGELQQGWFRYVWWFYALTLFMVLVRKYYKRLFDIKKPA